MRLALFPIAAALAATPVLAETRPIVDAAKVIDAIDVCRAAPQGRDATLDFARSKGFKDLPEAEQQKFPMRQYVPLMRDGVWLRTTDKVLTGWAISGGNCEVLAPVPAETSIAQVEATLSRKFGTPPTVTKSGKDEYHKWQIDGRTFSARMISGELNLFMSFPQPSEAELAAARANEEKVKAERIAALKAATVFSPATEFGAAAVGCLTALGPKALDIPAIERDGWVKTPESKMATAYRLGDSAVRILLLDGLMPGGQCIVDGYAKDSGEFKSIRDAVRDALAARTGKQPKMPGAPTPDGQGYVVGDLLMILSTEQRINGLSVRITSARIGGL